MNVMKNNTVPPAWRLGQGLTTHLTKNGVLRKVTHILGLEGILWNDLSEDHYTRDVELESNESR
jgi:hypothetical protein